jgi:hypothetical protein
LGSSSGPVACPCGRAPSSPCPTIAVRRPEGRVRAVEATRWNFVPRDSAPLCGRVRLRRGASPAFRIPARAIKPGLGTTRWAGENLVKNPRHSTVPPVSRRRAPDGDPQVARRRPAGRVRHAAKSWSDPKVRWALRRLPTETDRCCSRIPTHGGGAWRGRSELRPDLVPRRSRPPARGPLGGKAETWNRTVLTGEPKPVCQPAGRNPLAWPPDRSPVAGTDGTVEDSTVFWWASPTAHWCVSGGGEPPSKVHRTAVDRRPRGSKVSEGVAQEGRRFLLAATWHSARWHRLRLERTPTGSSTEPLWPAGRSLPAWPADRSPPT